MRKATGYIRGFVNLLYPELCASCGELLLIGEKGLCIACNVKLPRTNHHKKEGNPVERLFWGRIKVEAATAYYYYEEGSRFQNIMYELKYRGNKKIGLEMGKAFGEELMENKSFSRADMIVPVPLHPSRERKRGYNQSRIIADGMAISMKIPVVNNNLVRTIHTPTQTRRSRIGRWENVDQIFRVNQPGDLQNKHILLVDDLVTTGATLEACAQKIMNAGCTRISIAALAIA